MREERIYNCVTSDSLSKKGSSSNSVSEKGIKGPMDRFVVNVENKAVEDLRGSDKEVKGLKKEARENTCSDIADFFYENGLAFNVASSPSFVKMLRLVRTYEHSFKIRTEAVALRLPHPALRQKRAGNVSYALKTTTPLVSVLRMTDSKELPAMGFIYGAMDKTKEEIAVNMENEEGAYKEIWGIIDDKRQCQLHRHLHTVAYYLNPRFQY
ncbi:hypothetical protein Ddye_001917 [Dipteronia dyeriana]|uniref:Uncharacterized protein n=1 Tax=Dipteronia dyeriana TaxID=168575 RepID=A0AAE0CUG4_9ROSI|nr:hypothetical protein Ddye_001917 [Dipteronia dyeriana]